MPDIDLEEILHGTKPVTMQQLAGFWKTGEFHEEHYLVATIKKYLRTEEQRKLMFEHGFSIEDMLNGRVEGVEADALVDPIFAEWNAKLGHHAFGF